MTPCDILFIGDAPSIVEDSLGKPFRGDAGNLLDSILERAGIEPLTHCMTNLVTCFPDNGNGVQRAPKKSEIMRCFPRLSEFIRIASPSTIVTVGPLAEKYIKDWVKEDMTLISSTGHDYKPMYMNIPHPEYMLRTGGKDSISCSFVVTALRSHFQMLKVLKGW